MPKRRMTSRRRAQIRLWQAASVKARGKAVVPEWGSYSDPHLGREKLGWSHRKQRTIKYMGKNAHKHTGGVSESRPNGSVTLAPWAEQALAGKKVTHNPLSHDAGTLRGDMVVNSKGQAYRLPKPKPQKPVRPAAKKPAAQPNPQSIVGAKKIAMAEAHGMSPTEMQKKFAAESRKIKAAQKAADKKKYAAAKAAYKKTDMYKKYK